MQPSTVVLDVEGVLFKTRISTLTSVKGGYFESLLATDWQKRLNRDGHLFIDRDSAIFPIILNFHRDGTAIPLPQDEYFLARIGQEARYFRLYDLCDMIERKMSYGELPITTTKLQGNTSPSKSSKPTPKQKLEKSKSVKEKEGHGARIVPVSSSPIPVLSDYSQRLSIEEPPMPMKKSTLEKKWSKKKNNIESISLPRNFAHVAHVGWNGAGVIFENHLVGEEDTVRAIIQAAGETDLTPIYNMVDGENSEYGSHSVEVFLTGPHIQAKEIKKMGMDLYSKPQKRPPKTPPKPPASPFQRPASK